MSPTRILVLADTHNRLPPKLVSAASEVDEVWHLGDVCRESLLDELRAAGPPLTIVRGNCDAELSWPLRADLTRHGVRFRLQHIPPGAREKPACDVLLHGHTHVPRDETIAGVRFLNPGCVTRPNRGAPSSFAFLDFALGPKFTWRLVPL